MARKSKQVVAIAEWTGEARNSVYALLRECKMGEALEEIAKYRSFKMNDLAPVDKEAFTRFSKALAEDPPKQEELARNLFHGEQSVRRATRFLLGKLAVLDVRQLIPLMKELDESLVASLPATEAEHARLMNEFFSDGEEDAEMRKEFIASWQEEPWSVDRTTREFITTSTELIARAGVSPEIDAALAALHPKHLELWQLAGYRPLKPTDIKVKSTTPKTTKASAPNAKAKAKAVAESKEGDPRLDEFLRSGDLAGLLGLLQEAKSPESVLTGTDGALRGQFTDRIMANESMSKDLIEGLLSKDDKLRRAAAAVMRSLPRFPLMEFLQRLYEEIDGGLDERTDADRDHLLEISVTAARIHGTLQAVSFVLEWPYRHDKKWDWRGQILGAIASRFSFEQLLDAVRGDVLGGKFSYDLLTSHIEKDPDVSLFTWRNSVRVTNGDFPFSSLLSVCPPPGHEDYIGDHFAGRPNHPLDEHREELAARLRKDSSLAIRTRDWQFVLDWFWSVYMGDGGFDRLERELWTTFGDEVHAYCLRNKPGPNWYPALSLYMLGAEETDARLVEKWRAALSPTGDSNRYGDQCQLLMRFSKAVKLKEWWLPFFKLEWEHLLADHRSRMDSGARELYLHKYEQRIMLFYRHSKQFGSTAYDDALNSVLERLEGRTLLEKLTGTRIHGDFGLFSRAVVRRETDEEAQALLLHSNVIGNYPSYHDLAWRLRETRPEAVRAFLRRWQKPSQNSLPGYFVQRDSIEVFAAHGLFPEEVTQRIAASLEAKDEEEFNWAFDLAFAYPEMMTAQSFDVLELVAPRIHRPAKRQIVSDTIRRISLLGRYGRAPKDRVFAALEEAFQLDDPALWKKAAEGMREFRREIPTLALSNPDRVKDLIERDPKKYAPIFKGLI